MPAVKNVGDSCAGKSHARIEWRREETRPVGPHVPYSPGAYRRPYEPVLSGPKRGEVLGLPDPRDEPASGRGPAHDCEVSGALGGRATARGR